MFLTTTFSTLSLETVTPIEEKNCTQFGEDPGGSPLGVLLPALETPAQERHGSAGMGLEHGHKNDQKDGAPLL